LTPVFIAATLIEERDMKHGAPKDGDRFSVGSRGRCACSCGGFCDMPRAGPIRIPDA
jgi:hypothetical protein